MCEQANASENEENLNSLLSTTQGLQVTALWDSNKPSIIMNRTCKGGRCKPYFRFGKGAEESKVLKKKHCEEKISP